jgi:hypothetical protein
VSAVPASEKANHALRGDDALEALEADEREATVEPPPEKAEKISTYAVFCCEGDHAPDSDPQAVVENGEWSFVGTYEVRGNGGQREARRQAVEDNADLKAKISAGATVWFFCVAKRQLVPTPVFTERRDPVVRF